MKVVFVGAGGVATNMAIAIKKAGHDIVAIYSRTIESATTLAQQTSSKATADIKQLPTTADVYIISVSDSALPDVATKLTEHATGALVVHTAGSMPLTTIPGNRSGVLYPMQTFSRQRTVDFSCVPLFLECTDDKDKHTLESLAQSISKNVRWLNSEKRKSLHLAAVFACNFTNHCYHMAARILEKEDIPFSVMLPLTDETANKVHALSPHDAQTGPAVRLDMNVMQKHLGLLKDAPDLQEIYEVLSTNIHSMR